MKRNKMLLEAGILFLCSMFTALVPTLALGAVPRLINFSGVLRDGSGNPVPNGSYSVTFKIYDGPGGGAVTLWTENQSVATLGGLFTVLLGSATALPSTIFDDTTRYLGIKVASDPEMTPRVRLASVGYSFASEPWKSSGTEITHYPGRVILGPGASGDGLLDITDLGGAPSLTGIYCTVDNGSGTAFGVLGNAHSSTGEARGGYFIGQAPVGAIGYGVYSIGDNYGVYGEGGGFGVGFGTSYGGYFSGQAADDGTIGYGVYGRGRSIFGQSYGVYGDGGTEGGHFVGGNAGVYGGGGSFGVFGTATNSGGFGVFGSNNGNSTIWAGYFAGDSRVTGNLSVDGFLFKNGGGFKIDHPTDPANQYLYHSFVESPDMKNIYDGVVTTDAKGEAVVTLSEWFGALNGDFRYQLTAIGAPGPNLFVAEEISGNRFKIAGGTAGMKVSWQVTGIRQDAYAKDHRIPVEEEKTGKERGKYLHPLEQGVSEALGIHYEETQKLAAEHKQMEEEHAKMEVERKQQEEQRVKMEQEQKVKEHK